MVNIQKTIIEKYGLAYWIKHKAKITERINKNPSPTKTYPRKPLNSKERRRLRRLENREEIIDRFNDRVDELRSRGYSLEYISKLLGFSSRRQLYRYRSGEVPTSRYEGV